MTLNDQHSLIRQAAPEEAGLLSGLAMESKASWGYDPDFLEVCRGELTLTPEFVKSSEVWVVEAERAVVGFYSLGPRGQEVELAHFFVAPGAIGRGYGRLLWQHAVEAARNLGFRYLMVESDPYAEGFYQKMGAERVGEAPSTVQSGRLLPLLRFPLGQPTQARSWR